MRADRIPAQVADVVDRGDEARKQLVRERARLEAAADGLVACRPHLVGPPTLEYLGSTERHSEVRPEELVGRAGQDVDAELGDVDRCMRREVHGVRPRERARLVSQLGDYSRI